MNSRIYRGAVMHCRNQPVEHGWEFPYYFYAIDIDELDLIDKTVKGFGYNRWAPVRLLDRDYLREEGAFRKQLAEFVSIDSIDRIVLVTMARFILPVFNPVSFYYCLKKDGTAATILAEVNNTFGERHLYAMDCKGPFPVSCSSQKAFHVSPFNDMEGHYAFTFSAPDNHIRILIRLIRDGEVVMDAAMWGEGRELTTANLWKTILRHPITAALTMPRILWQAAQLRYKKKLPVFHKPAPTSSMTIKERA